MNLKDPLVAQDEGSVTVTLRHEPLATPEEIIIEFLHKHGRSGISKLAKCALLGLRIR
jgi:ATP-dependent DNA helicase RecG